MAFTVTANDLYTFAAREDYFSGVDAGVIASTISAALGECSRKLAPRVGGPPSSWTFTDEAGEAECTRDVCVVAGSDLALSQGLTLPGEGADPQWAVRAVNVRALWSRMGTVGERDRGKVEPLYAGLVDATPLVTEGAPTGWATELGTGVV